jgi:hypothetical protein
MWGLETKKVEKKCQKWWKKVAKSPEKIQKTVENVWNRVAFL